MHRICSKSCPMNTFSCYQHRSFNFHVEGNAAMDLSPKRNRLNPRDNSK
uniref:Uncharacterized protein n=1 Tax=Arundo donax TaxID=35708 RepID=A0A0A9ASH2_ARUDO